MARFPVRFLVAAMLVAVSSGSATARPQRWAVIASPTIRDMPAGDLIVLVERGQLDKAFGETARSRITGPADASRRVEAGKLVGADVLVLLIDDTSLGRRRVRMILTDCTLGARLSTDELPFPAESPERQQQMAADVARVATRMRQRFPDGVRWVVGVTPFASKDLSHKHDDLQAGAALLIANALSAVPGVAVLETDEARALRNEQDVAGQQVNRVMPVIVRGEFAYTDPPDADPLASFEVALDTGPGAAPTVVRSRS